MSVNRVNEIMANYQKAKTKRQNKENLFRELDAFDRNEQWYLQDAPPWMPKPVTNYIHLVKYTKRAAFAVENPTGKLRPVSPAGAERVVQLNKAYEDTFERIKARSVVRDTIGTAKLLGTAIAHMYWDEYKEGRMGTTVLGDEGFQYEGEIVVKELDPGVFYPDPNAFSIEECSFIIVRERKNEEWVKKNPKFKDRFNTKDPTDPENNPQERGEIYIRDYTTSQSTGLVDFISYYTKEMNKEGGFDYHVEYIADGQYLLKEKLRPNRYPFSILYDFQQRQDFWGMSTCQIILDNQKIINKVESIITLLGTMMQNPQKVVTASSGINPKLLNKYGWNPGQTWVTNDPNPGNSIRYVEVPQIPMALMDLLATAKQNIRDIAGMSESYMGQNVGSLQTSSGVQALIDRSTMRDRDQMYDIEMFVEDLSKMTIDFMTEYYEEERLIRILDERGDVVSFEPFIGKEFADLDYDIRIDVSAKAPITRMREAQEAKELINLQGQFGYPVSLITPQELIKSLNLANGEAIIDRMNSEEMQNQVNEAMEVANMIFEAMQQGVPAEEVQQMAVAMFEQMEQGGGVGNVAGPQDSFNPQNAPQGAM